MSATVLQFPKPAVADGGKARILRKRDNFKFRIPPDPIKDHRDDLYMDHADTCDSGMPSDSAYHAPEYDGA